MKVKYLSAPCRRRSVYLFVYVRWGGNTLPEDADAGTPCDHSIMEAKSSDTGSRPGRCNEPIFQ